MHVLFVHGMGRTPLSGMLLLRRLRRGGISTSTFGYSATLQAFESIRDRLRRRLVHLALEGEYVVLGHSLGGVLLRSALAELPSTTRLPSRMFLLGSPVIPARMALKLRDRWVYRVLAGDCGQLLASDHRMAAIGPVPVKTISIIGTRGLNGKHSPFLDELNDGVVAASELAAGWIAEEIQVPVVHTLLPASTRVAELLLERLKEDS